jgi:alpha-L-rhamnosidase
MGLDRMATFLVLTAVVWAAPRAEGMSVSHLRCEYLEDPVGLDVTAPRLSWRMTSDHRAARQSAYQVEVSAAGRTLWDTGKVAGDRSTQVEYAGPPLCSGQLCQWRVRVWDEAGRGSDWSPPATWSMGPLTLADWGGARWIGMAGAANVDGKPPAAPMLRKAFDLPDRPVRRATAHVCGLGYAELYVNGGKVGDHVLDPPITAYDKRALYVSFDVTKQLVAGPNAIGLMLGNGEYNVTVGDAWGFQRAPWGALPQAIVLLDVEYDDGTRRRVVSDGSWRGATGPITFDQTRVGERYDARLERPGWSRAAYDGTWTPVAVRDGPRGTLHAADVEPIRVVQTIHATRITEPKPGVYVFDLGQNITGWERLTARAPTGTAVRMSCAEILRADGTVDRWNANQFVRSPDVQADTYTFNGSGTEAWEPRFTFHGFQFVQVEGLPSRPGLDAIAGRVVRTSFEPSGTFGCSNELVNRIERATVWSYAGNFVGLPTDCPQREKNGWTGDAQLAVALGLEHFHGEAAYTRWLNDFDDAQHRDGKLPGIVPSPGWGYGVCDGPAWESAYFLIPWELYLRAGDTRVLARHYNGWKRWMDCYAAKARGQIVGYGLSDWTPAKTKTPADITSTAYYFRDAQIVATTADLFGRIDDAKRYHQLAADIATAYNAKFFDAKSGQYGNGSQTSLSCPLYFGLVPAPDRARVVRNLVDAVHRASDHIDTGILGSKFVLRALSDGGHADLGLLAGPRRDDAVGDVG